jgi:3-methylcrotonyl-CoA carboxylase alpha subunit
MIRRLLIANRGEIACRVIRTARRLGIETIGVYSDADRTAPHVRLADRAFHIGPPPARDSYLNVGALIAAARDAGADAVHPGYGFLSENASFAEACAAAGCVFVGPPADAIRCMGSKATAKQIAAEAGVAVVPGYHGARQEPERVMQEAERVGFPLLIKPSAGGGGKGMRRVEAAADLGAAIDAARREALAAFGDDTLLLERYIESPKHIEIQILADDHGHVLYLFERDCSVQRRHQKIIEEAPAPGVTPELRQRLGHAAVALARAIDYRGAGTVEFIGDGREFYFMEMNTRLQVEHPVTEAITGLDLVEWQLRIAAGEPLPFEQENLVIDGAAIEARIYAENPRNQFLPSTGRIVHLAWPDGVRVDAGIAAGDEVSAHYDPMLAKVIAHAPDRAQAIALLARALSTTELAGVEHNVGFLRKMLNDPEFESGTYDVGLIERRGEALVEVDDMPFLAAIALALMQAPSHLGAWDRHDGFRLNLPAEQTLRLSRAGQTLEVVCRRTDGGYDLQVGERRLSVADVRGADGRVEALMDGRWFVARIVIAGDGVHCMHAGSTLHVRLLEEDPGRFDRDVLADGRITAPMPGQVLAVYVHSGEQVETGQPLLVLEAMKMEHTIRAPMAGVVRALTVAVGTRIEEGAELVVIEAE